jgi:GrpB-like predicted nucleotidyltransferase (UPF0157 family)
MADATRVEIEAARPGLSPVIEHIGSTANPGLAAKPIIDLMAATVSLDAVAVRQESLARSERGLPSVPVGEE